MTGLQEEFKRRYNCAPEWIVAAPGRVNLIGEHTDHNGGFVLPMAINRMTQIAAGRNRDATEPLIDAYSINLHESDSFPASDRRLEPAGLWTDYVKGVLAEFLDRGVSPGSLNMVVWSDIPIGCGLSSSAALQVATARLLQQFDAGTVADAEVPGLCQVAEHKFTGVPVGIMDQFCIAKAREGCLVFLDCRSLQAEHVPFADPEVAVLIVNSHVSRELRSGAYAERRGQCIEACRIMGIDELRDATEQAVAAASDKLGDVCYRRARHVTSENARTVQAVAAIRAQDWHQLGQLMYASHDSLATDFDVSCEELDILVDIARQVGIDGGVYGSRMTGGGFGGCTVSLIRRDSADMIIQRLQSGYCHATGIELTAYVATPCHGVRVLQSPAATNR